MRLLGKFLIPLFLFQCFQFDIFCETEIKEPIKVSIGQIPIVAEPGEKGAYPDFIREMAKSFDKKIIIRVRPFSRSLSSLIKGKVDIHLPIIEPLTTENLPYDMSTSNISGINFVLYANKNKPLDLENLSDKKIETDSGHTHLFPFKIEPSTCSLCSLKKVNSGRIDGFIYADSPIDPLIKKEKLNNIHRSLYRRYNVKFVLPKGSRGGPMDLFLTKAMVKLKENGIWQKHIYPYTREYDDWQP